MSQWTERLIYLLLLLAVLLGSFQCGQQRAVSEAKIFMEAYQDSIHYFRNNEGLQEAYTLVLQSDISSLKALSLSKDSTLKRLSELVKKGSRTITVLQTNTSDSGSAPTILQADTSRPEFPIYTASWSSKWDSFYIVATRDSIFRRYTVKNEFDIRHTWASTGFLQPKALQVEVLSLNPNSQTTGLRSWSIKQPKANRILWGLSGFALGFFSGMSVK